MCRWFARHGAIRRIGVVERFALRINAQQMRKLTVKFQDFPDYKVFRATFWSLNGWLNFGFLASVFVPFLFLICSLGLGYEVSKGVEMLSFTAMGAGLLFFGITLLLNKSIQCPQCKRKANVELRPLDFSGNKIEGRFYVCHRCKIAVEPWFNVDQSSD